MSRLNIYWIDDDANKINAFVDVIQHGTPNYPDGATITSIIVDRNLIDVLADLTTNAPPPDLIIIDHIFSKIKLPLKLKGSSVAHLLRGTWPNVPMICVTGALLNQPKKFDQEDLSEYTAVFQYPGLSTQLEKIYAIASDFSDIPIGGKNLREQLARLLGVPPSEKSTFLRVLPSEFDVNGFMTTTHRIAHWLFNHFMVRPGFLYNKLRTATYLGLNEPGLEKVREVIEPARYKGPFSNTVNPLWWVSELEKILLDVTPENGPVTTQLMGRDLPGIVQQDFSTCYVGENPDDIPDVVARLTPGSDEVQVCVRHTQSDPEDKAVQPGFESLLIVSNR